MSFSQLLMFFFFFLIFRGKNYNGMAFGCSRKSTSMQREEGSNALNACCQKRDCLFIVARCQGHQTTVFCKISVWRSRCSLEFSITWARLKISRWQFHSWTIFEAGLFDKFPTISLSVISQISLLTLGIFSQKKRKPKVFGFKIGWREESVKFSFS